MDLSELLGGASAARKRDADILGKRKQVELEGACMCRWSLSVAWECAGLCALKACIYV